MVNNRLKKLPRGVTTDKERGKFRATFKGWSVRCDTIEQAVTVRRELRKRGPHPSYIARRQKKTQPARERQAGPRE